MSKQLPNEEETTAASNDEFRKKKRAKTINKYFEKNYEAIEFSTENRKLRSEY